MTANASPLNRLDPAKSDLQYRNQVAQLGHSYADLPGNERWLSIVSGKNLVMNVQSINPKSPKPLFYENKKM